MATVLDDTIVGITPFEQPDAALAVAIQRAGACAVLDLGRDGARALAALDAVVRADAGLFGVRLGDESVARVPLPPQVELVIGLAAIDPRDWAGRRVLAQVTCLAEARAAIARGVHGLIVKGHESGGRVGDETSLVLLQRVMAEARVPVWVQGGVGLHGAAACIAGGARGVVLDAQLALLREATPSADVRRVLASMDGSETAVLQGHRFLSRPDVFAPEPGWTGEQIARAFGSQDLSTELLAAGQDAAFSRPLAERFGSVRALVRGLRAAIAGQLQQASKGRVLGPGSPLAVEHGLSHPVVQGPMTRVSDRPAFARAVAEAGGLPFLALALMRGAEARALLTETASLLADRQWGVGILGFVPPEIRQEQMAVLEAIRPPAAIIAGGRPAQARQLEAAGIRTYLHVPSPGLLDLFLKDGARRFVFEGRECGGHVGPRSSLVLWEMAIQRLLEQQDLSDVRVLFAGGIQDARSAAMVSAMAAPLAARGAGVGVLMGTAYLFTEEAVGTGAITAAFQEAALGCQSTVLLETAPGHATRCADSTFARTFEEERQRLQSAGASAQEIWAALEQLNLGRLRIAAKGVGREGGELRAVDDEGQRRQGMFMMGQVAALRDRPTTVADLHREVTAGAAAELARAAGRDEAGGLRRPSAVRADIADVAIVGMACIFPDAPDLATYWKNIVLGKNAIREVPPERWNAGLYFDPAGTGDKTPSRWGAFLPETPFDPGAYGIPPLSLAAIEPVQLLSLEVAQRALADAGYAGGRAFDRERASVVFGAEAGTDLSNAYNFRAAYPQYLGTIPPALDACLPRLTEDSFPGVLANVIAGRIANRLDLGGLNFTVDAACASSLAAIDVACKELLHGSSDLVIAGGADLHNGIQDFLMFASVHALSPTGQCRPFDAAADGIALGEGVAAVVLKRREDAERDGDRIYAVIKGVGGSSDGRSLGLTAPRKEGQIRALERAYARAGLTPSQVELIEAHGTGTVVGDRTELGTLTEVCRAAGTPAGACTLGSVKSLIGHTKCAAGMAGLIKTALALSRGVLPPTNVSAPNPGYASSSPFLFRDRASAWTATERRAGVSAFGFGGTNFHLVLESASGEPPPDLALEDWPAELFLIRGRDREQARARLELLARRLDDERPHRLRDLACTVAGADGPVQLALVASDHADLRSKIRAALAGAGADGVFPGADQPDPGAVAFLFPGQGSQRPHMLADLFVAFPELHPLLRRGGRWRDRLFPGAAFTAADRTAQQQALTDTRVAQPALGIANLAMARLLARHGVMPAMAGGHSYGELVALAVSGALPEAALLDLSEARAECILAAAGEEPGTMAAVRAGAAAVTEALAGFDGVVLANHNAPDQTVIAGAAAAVDLACQRLEARGLGCRRIPVACAFHSPLVAGARTTFADSLADVELGPARFPVYGNTTAAPYPADPAAMREQLCAQLAEPVRFAEQIEAMYRAGARVFVEAGPGAVLTDLVGRILAGRPHLAVACDGAGATGQGLAAFLPALGRLAAVGVPVDVRPLFAGRDARPVDLEVARSFAPTTWMVNGQLARPLHGEPPEFAMRPVTSPVAVPHPGDPPVDEREATVLEYMRGMRELVEAQREVMLRYLGAPADAREVPVTVEARAAVPAVLAALPSAEAPAPSAPVPAVSSPLEALVVTVSERTGYPRDMLDLDLDLEADLGIDSIKRIEILGTLSTRLGLQLTDGVGGRSDAIEALAGVKTLRGIAAWLDQHVGGAARSALGDAAPAEARPAVTTMPPAALLAAPRRVGRYLLSVGPLPAAVPNGVTVRDRRFAIVADGRGVAPALARLLEERGARAVIVAPSEPLGPADGLIFLESITADGPGALKRLFGFTQQAAQAGAHWIVAATGLGGSFGHGGGDSGGQGGAAGLLKSVAKERPDLRVRAIDLHPGEDPGRLAQHVYDELLADDARVEVGYTGGVRQSRTVVSAPAAERAETPGLSLDKESVVLITGGARGITARIAVGLAQKFRCRLELVGRSPLPAPGDDADEDPALAAATDLLALRRTLLARANGAGLTTPAAIEGLARRILAVREIRATLTALQQAGVAHRYHAIDVRQRAAFAGLIDDIYARHGRLDGVIHGAGLVEDKLLEHKTRESFDRVFDTKVQSALTLIEKLRADTRFVVFFSSVSGAFGNRGQVDYAAANDLLDTLAHRLQGRLAGRVLSINWGPWGGVGMVGPELEREYARRGIDLIPPVEGVERFLEELRHGRHPQVILTATAEELLA